MLTTRHAFRTWEWGGSLGEEGLRHQVLLDAMHLFQVTQDILDLLRHHLVALLPVGSCLSEAIYVHPVGGVGTTATLKVAPEIALVICVGGNVGFHLTHGHLQRETNSMH